MKMSEIQRKMNLKSTEITTIYKEKIVQIKAEYDVIMTTIESAMMAATGNYDRKCREFEAISNQLDEERTNNVTLKQQIISLENTIKRKDELISEQKKSIDNSNQNETVYLDVIDGLKRENLKRIGPSSSNVVDTQKGDQDVHKEMAIIKGMLTEMIAFEMYALEIEQHKEDINNLIEIGRMNEKNQDSKENMCVLANLTPTTINDIQLVRANSHMEKIQNLLKSERENFTLIHRQQRNRIEKMTKVLKLSIRNTSKLNKLYELEREKTTKLSIDILNIQFKSTKMDSRNQILKQQLKFKESFKSMAQPEKDEFDQELFKKQRDKIKALQIQLKQTEERAEKNIIFQHQLLTKLKEMSNTFTETVSKNYQLIQSLTSKQNVLKSRVINLDKFRRALVYQKQYLMFILKSYESLESRMIVNDSEAPQPRKIPSFKSVVLATIAVGRMKPRDQAR